MDPLFFKFNSTILAEGEGFEPSVRVSVRRFSRPVPSTTRSPFQLIVATGFWRRERDSNPRWVAPYRFSRAASSTTPAPLQIKMVHPARFERTTFGSASQRSIQLSYGCIQPFGNPIGYNKNIKNFQCQRQ